MAKKTREWTGRLPAGWQASPDLRPLVWVTFPLGEGLSFLVGLLRYRRIRKGTIQKLGEG